MTLRVLHSLDSWNLGGIQELVLKLHLYSRNEHATWGYAGTMTPYMREAGMVHWEGGPPDDQHYDVVIEHTVGGWSGHGLSGWARQRGTKIVECMHSNAYSPTPPEDLDGWIGLNHQTRQMNPLMPKATTIYGILNAADFSQHRGPAIGRLSRLASEKCPNDFLDLACSFPKQQFIMAGDGPLFEQLRAASPSNLSMVGWVRDFGDYYSKLKLFVFPTRDECCSMSLAMAQAAGLPCIVQDLRQLRETTGENAIFCNSLPDFVSQINNFLSDPGRYDEMAAAGRSWAYSHFDKSVTVTAWDAYLESL